MLSLVAGVAARPVGPSAAIRPQDGDACAAGDQDYYMTQPGGSEHEGGHMFVYTSAIVPEVGTEIELSGFPDEVFTVEEFSDSSRGQLEGANAQSFAVTAKGGVKKGEGLRDSNSDACYTDTEYFALSSGGAGSEEGGGHIYVHTLGPHPPVGTKVTLQGTASTLTGKHYNPEMTKIKTIEWEVVEGDWDTPKGTKESGNPRSFAMKTADGSSIGSILPYDKQNSYACYGNNEIYKIVGGGECGAGGYVYLYTRSARPPIGTNVFLTAYKDVEFEVVEDLDDSTPCGSQRSARERENPLSFLLRTVDGGPTHLPLPIGTRSDALSPPEPGPGEEGEEHEEGEAQEEGEESAKMSKAAEKLAAKMADKDEPDFSKLRFSLGEDDPEGAPTIGRWGCKGAPGYDQVPLGIFSCESTSDPDVAIGTFACHVPGEEGEEGEEGEHEEGEAPEQGEEAALLTEEGEESEEDHAKKEAAKAAKAAEKRAAGRGRERPGQQGQQGQGQQGQQGQGRRQHRRQQH